MLSHLPLLRVTVLDQGTVSSHHLSAPGTLRLGSSDDAEVRLPLPEALLILRAETSPQFSLCLENQGAAAVPFDGGVLNPGARQPLEVGRQCLLGTATLTVEPPGRAPSRFRRIASHAYFEARVDEECFRASYLKSHFGLLRIRVDGPLDPAKTEAALANGLRIIDVVGHYGPNEYEVLLLDTTPQGAQSVRERLRQVLAKEGITATVGLSCFPLDARGADELMAMSGDAARSEKDAPPPAPAVLGTSERMAALHELVDRIAPTPIRVLILGETGVGKEVLAQRIHDQSDRAGRPLVRLNVAALPESLLESELFGFERGSFTGAVQAKPGLLETVEGGTVFLDEIGELPLAFQVKLLRVLESGVVYRIGALKPRSIDVRIVCATHRDLDVEIDKGTFRKDLYYRLNGITLRIPPLRERLDELESLAGLFIEETCRRTGRKTIPRLTSESLTLMRQYLWPGNIRELRSAMERAVILSVGDWIGPEALPSERLRSTFAERKVEDGRRLATMRESDSAHLSPKMAVDPFEPVVPPVRGNGRQRKLLSDEARAQLQAIERQRIIEALNSCGGNQTAAARLLGISRRTLILRLEEYRLPRPRSRSE